MLLLKRNVWCWQRMYPLISYGIQIYRSLPITLNEESWLPFEQCYMIVNKYVVVIGGKLKIYFWFDFSIWFKSVLVLRLYKWSCCRYFFDVFKFIFFFLRHLQVHLLFSSNWNWKSFSFENFHFVVLVVPSLSEFFLFWKEKLKAMCFR